MESDSEFVEGLVEIAVCDWDQAQFDRLFALARKGAEADRLTVALNRLADEPFSDLLSVRAFVCSVLRRGAE